MKLFYSMLLLLVLESACKKEKLAPETILMEMPMDTMATASANGQFMNGPYGIVSGRAILFRNTNGSFEIKLENFNTSNGPDLFVYLSKEIMPANFIQLEKLKSTTGDSVLKKQLHQKQAEKNKSGIRTNRLDSTKTRKNSEDNFYSSKSFIY